ncbi:MAG: response regulator, partial [Lachnospiraceae bacterium]|nr:response regulator [Lachnospiraceae bacterium]
DRIALSEENIPESTRGYLEKIDSSAEHLLGIINDILDMSRIEAGGMTLRYEVFSLPVLLEQIDIMIGGQCREKGVKWKPSLSSETNEFYMGDDMKLKQVLINILGNAVKFTPTGGTVSFTTELVAHYENKTTIRFVMKDTGIGMSEDYIPKLFEPFSQEDLSTKTKYGSTGLGMSITKSIVEIMNGEIKVESKKNEGTTFYVTVTLDDSEKDVNEVGDVVPKKMHVLIVDDDPVASRYAKVELEKAGVASDIANSGQEAIEMVRLKHTRRDAYNLMLIDWKMPDMDGLETTKQIRAIAGTDSAIIILTSYQWEDIMDEATEAGVDTFIIKPLRANSIMDQFKQAFAIKAKNSKNKADLEGRRILLAEDIEVNAQIMEMVLQMRKMEVDHAENGKIAVDKFMEHPEGYYDAILMDMRMPEMDGLEATKVIRSSGRGDATLIPIIALTANAFDEDVQRSLQAGLNAHLSKPVEPDNLYETLESLIRP